MAATATSPDRLLGADDRRAVRKAVVDSGLVTVEMCPAGFGLMVNVSERGIAVYTMKNLAPAQDVQVSFMLPGSPRRIECNGVVTWAAESHAGLKLEGFDAQSLAAFRRWIATLPEVPSYGDPKLQRRAFPERDQQVRSIEAHIAGERLKLDVALQFIVERMLDLTQANGGAIALGEAGQMVCRASVGSAPEVGVQISSTSGITGECIRTGKEIYCEDAAIDARVDREACRELNLRSLLIVPVLHQDKVAGVVEAFSSIPAAFEEDHRWLVKRLAEITATTAYSFSPRHPPSPGDVIVTPVEIAPEPVLQKPLVPEPAITRILRKQVNQRSLFALIKPYWPLSVFGGSVLLLSLAWHNAKPAATSVQSSTPTAVANSATPPNGGAISSDTSAYESPRQDASKTRISTSSDGGPNSKTGVPKTEPVQVIALPPSSTPGEPSINPETAPDVQLASAASLPRLNIPAPNDKPELLKTSTLSGGALVHQVQPIYPPRALQMGLQGDVILNAHINKRGKVTFIKVVSGDPLLADAALAAVHQWRYEPFKRDNVPQDLDVDVRLKFRTPKR